MTEEKKYPIYKVSVKWIEDGEHDPEWVKRSEGLPEGRIRNSTSFYQMFRELQDINTLKQDIIDNWWPSYLKAHENKEDRLRSPIINPSDLGVTVEFLWNESWCPSWFSHWTFDDGRSDQELLDSFTHFVQHMKKLGEDKYCLMGAEDRWRWKGRTDDGERTTEPPCHCKWCKERGIVRIDH